MQRNTCTNSETVQYFCMPCNIIIRFLALILHRFPLLACIQHRTQKRGEGLIKNYMYTCVVESTCTIDLCLYLWKIILSIDAEMRFLQTSNSVRVHCSDCLSFTLIPYGAEYYSYWRRGEHLAFSTRLPQQRDSVRCHSPDRMDTLQASPSGQGYCRGKTVMELVLRN